MIFAELFPSFTNTLEISTETLRASKALKRMKNIVLIRMKIYWPVIFPVSLNLEYVYDGERL